MRWCKRLAAALVCSVLPAAGLLAPSPAWAGAIYDGAGYKLTGIHVMTMTFTMPKVTCPAVRQPVVDFGLIAPDHKWAVVASAQCFDHRLSYGLEIDTDHIGEGEVGGHLDGHAIKVQMLRDMSGRTRLSIDDLTSGDGIALNTRQDTSVVAAGAYAPNTLVPAFTDTTVRLAANGGQPFTAFAPVRHTQSRDGTKLIGTGFPWNDGHHFTLYFKHA